MTVLNVAHRKSNTFVSKSISLSPVDEKLLLPTAHNNRGHNGTKEVISTFAFRVVNNAESADSSHVSFTNKKQEHNGKEKDKILMDNAYHTFQLDFVFFAAGYIDSSIIAHYLNSQQYFQRMVPKLRAALLKEEED